jgi:hypothetical protein
MTAEIQLHSIIARRDKVFWRDAASVRWEANSFPYTAREDVRGMMTGTIMSMSMSMMTAEPVRGDSS